MPVMIKRYPNRKLYDTEAKQYITLEGIADLIRTGQEVQVTDNASGDDLTALTLSQIIFEQEKKQSGFLPRSLLANLIQAGGEGFSAIQRTISSTLGFCRQMDAEIQRRVQTLIHEGKLTEREGISLLEKLLDPGLRDESAIPMPEAELTEAELEKHLHERGVPTRDDVQKLMEQLDSLATKITDMDLS